MSRATDQSSAYDAAALRTWIGRTERVADALAPEQALAAAATLAPEGEQGDEQRRDERAADDAAAFVPGAPLPPLWHWFYFLPRAPQPLLGADGHPPRGGFLPPVPYPRRMFAGARVRVHRPLRLGRPAVRTGTVRDVTLKEGKSGRLAFVTVGYEFAQDGVRCLEEEQDIVYREPGPAAEARVDVPPDAPWAPLPEGAWARVVAPDPRLLFRFSALTFNAHRIHYDRPYAREVEGYPGLVVHGPLTAVLLLELVRARLAAAGDGRQVVAFSFRGLAPLFDLAPFRLVAQPQGDAVELQAQGPDGRVALAARVELAAGI